jgi:methylated-DNA-protein-cysteine methyltransferase-like protein
MNASHKHDKAIPAHRVVNRNGLLSGKMHFESPDAMQKSLEAEGILIVNDMVQDFKRLLWDPMDMTL